MPATRTPETDRAIAEIAAELDATDIGLRMAGHLIRTIPELTPVADDDFRVVLVGSCTSNVATILTGLVEGVSIEDATPPPDATVWAHELAHRGMPLAALLRAYRLGHWFLETAFQEASADFPMPAEDRIEVLAAASQQMFGYVDVVCTQLVDEYEAEREQWLRGAAAAQSDLLHRLLDGEPVDAAQAHATLRYDVTAEHVAFIVWHDPAVRPSPGATAAARALGRELGGTQTLVLPVGEHAAWGWTTGHALVAPARRARALENGLAAAIGQVHEGVDGMRRSNEEARAARRVAEITAHRPGTVTSYSSVALLSLLLADVEHARRFAQAELGALGSDSDTALRLRATVRVLLQQDGNLSTTARRLGIHVNTVKYRVRRAEALLGRPLAQRRLELEIALELLDAVGDLPAT